MPAHGRLRRSTVRDVIHLTDTFVRIVLDGDLHDFTDNGTDQHIAIYFYPPEAIIPASLDPAAVTALHEFAMPRVRRYTICSFSQVTETVEVDVVKHGNGLASTWASTVRPGDEVIWWGATEAWPPPTSGHLVMVADDSALPAVAATRDALPPEVELDVIGIDADQAYLPHTPAHGDSLPDVIRSIVRPSTTVWAGAEYRHAGAVRRLLLGEMGMTVRQARVTTYWIAGQPQDKRPDERNRRRNLENRDADPERAARFIRQL